MKTLNNRELALIVWAALVVACLVLVPTIRRTLLSLAGTILRPTFSFRIILLGLWTFAEIEVGDVFGLWDESLWTDVGFWFVTSAIVLFFNSNKVGDKPHFFRRSAAEVFAISSVLEAYTGLFAFSLPVELILLPVTAVLATLLAVAQQKPELHIAKRFIELLFSVLGLSFAAYVFWSIVTGWNDLDKGNLAAELFLPMWLTLGVLPFIYLIGLQMAYEGAFVRLRLGSQSDWWIRTKLKLALIVVLHFRVARVARTVRHMSRLSQETTFAGGLHAVRRIQAEISMQEAKEQDKADRLKNFAGVDGFDGQGRRLDQNEFDETKSALEWLSTCMGGWYQRRCDGKYPTDLIDRFSDDFTRFGLPIPSGIFLIVSDDRQSWRAWRQTSSAWCLAVGGNGPPTTGWYFDGPSAPQTYPPGPGWFSDLDDQLSPNW